jgi:hypothetical protein
MHARRRARSATCLAGTGCTPPVCQLPTVIRTLAVSEKMEGLGRRD